jgi:sec-independent protein translocase protein TatB
MFGIGMSELLVILIIGLVVIGPKQLPEVARTLGKLFAQFKRTTNDLREQVDREVRQFTEMEEVKEFKRSMEEELSGMKSQTEDFVKANVEEGERLARLEEEPARTGPGDAGTLAGDAPRNGPATADSVEFSSTRADGGLPPGKLPS